MIIEADNLEKVKNIINSGGVVSFPTDTVYGIGARIDCSKALSRIYQIKGRPKEKALIVLISDKSQLKELATKVNKTEERLMDLFWPGPLTIIFDARVENISDIIRAGKDTVAIRLPKEKQIQDLLTSVDRPLVAPSANRSGEKPLLSSQAVYSEFGEEIDGVWDKYETTKETGKESTIVRVEGDAINILRQGVIKASAFESFGFVVK